MNLIQKAAMLADANCNKFRHQMLADLEWRRTTCNRIARILRHLGMPDAKADQADSGRRDVTATIHGHKLIVGCFYGHSRHIAILAPQQFRESETWQRVSPDLRSLPHQVSAIALKIFTAA